MAFVVAIRGMLIVFRSLLEPDRKVCWRNAGYLSEATRFEKWM